MSTVTASSALQELPKLHFSQETPPQQLLHLTITSTSMEEDSPPASCDPDVPPSICLCFPEPVPHISLALTDFSPPPHTVPQSHATQAPGKLPHPGLAVAAVSVTAIWCLTGIRFRLCHGAWRSCQGDGETLTRTGRATARLLSSPPATRGPNSCSAGMHGCALPAQV